mmetsp:Transcript_12984/g.15233  ORF Transcript_12984/g.15233 Transcript_12984/m.15233 type:complete len:431 (+) Transcript_12984:38-1330(+)
MRLLFVLISSILLAHDTSASLPCLSHVKSSFKIYTVAGAKKKSKCKLHGKLAKSLTNNGFTKVMCPFGILLVATEKYPDELLKYGANIIANLIDNDNDGKADDWKTLKALAHRGKKGTGAALVCGVNQSEEQKEENLKGLAWTFSCQTWKAGISAENDYKAIMFEEGFHMVHQGWAASMPEAFGDNNFQDSVVSRETARHQCVKPGWWHPENTCPEGAPFLPGNPASSPLQPGTGDCAASNCDVFEFYRQAATLYMDWTELPFWYSSYMPTSKDKFMEMASEELLTMMADPSYHQPQKALSGVYTRKKIGSNGVSRGACRDDWKFKVNGNNCKWVSQSPIDRCTLSKVKEGCKKSCENCPCNQVNQADDDMYDYDDSTGDDNSGDGGPTGEEVCEGKNYSEQACLALGNGCCHYYDNVCWSSIGQNVCDL